MHTQSVVVLGAGQIGSRHLQALARLELPAHIQVIDPSQAALAQARARLAEVPASSTLGPVQFLTDLSGVAAEIDLAIIASNADVRLDLLKALLSAARVKSVVLEKVAFQSIEQFAEAEALLASQRVACWVNCPRRLYPVYQDVKRRLAAGTPIHFSLAGGSWGLACNAIHFVDLVAFLTGDSCYHITQIKLDPEVQQSRRAGFVEFTGTVEGSFSRGSTIALTSLRDSTQPVQLTIRTPQLQLRIDEQRGQLEITTDSTGGSQTLDFVLPRQSELTDQVASEILLTGRSRLASLEESRRLHEPLLRAFMQHLSTTGYAHKGLCPIT